MVLRVKTIHKGIPREVLPLLIPAPISLLSAFNPFLIQVYLVSDASFLYWKGEFLKLGHRRDSALSSYEEQNGGRKGG